MFNRSSLRVVSAESSISKNVSMVNLLDVPFLRPKMTAGVVTTHYEYIDFLSSILF